MTEEKLQLTAEWDKTFPKSDAVHHEKVTFYNSHGDAAHSCYMGRDAFAQLKGDNKELVLVPGATHTDLYDGGGKNAIPWDQIQAFFERYL